MLFSEETIDIAEGLNHRQLQAAVKAMDRGYSLGGSKKELRLHVMRYLQKNWATINEMGEIVFVEDLEDRIILDIQCEEPQGQSTERREDSDEGSGERSDSHTEPEKESEGTEAKRAEMREKTEISGSALSAILPEDVKLFKEWAARRKSKISGKVGGEAKGSGEALEKEKKGGKRDREAAESSESDGRRSKKRKAERKAASKREEKRKARRRDKKRKLQKEKEKRRKQREKKRKRSQYSSDDSSSESDSTESSEESSGDSSLSSGDSSEDSRYSGNDGKRLSSIARRSKRAERIHKLRGKLDKIGQEGIRKQYQFNAERMFDVKDIARHLKGKSGERIVRVFCKKVEERQKHLLIADKHGWDVVAEYETNVLASGSSSRDIAEDSRRLARALKAVKEVTRENTTSLKWKPQVAGGAAAAVVAAAATAGQQKGYVFPGKCHVCRKTGHKRQDCPTKK